MKINKKYLFVFSFFLLIRVFAIEYTGSGNAFNNTTLEEFAPVQITGGKLPDGIQVPKLIEPAKSTDIIDFNGVSGKKAVHEGIDYVHDDSNIKNVFIKPAAKGIVVYVRSGCPQSSMFKHNTFLREAGSGWGNHIVIYHGNNIYTRYAHLKPGSIKVLPGDIVMPSDEIAQMGNSGRSETRHLHFELGYRKEKFNTDISAKSFDLVFNPEFFMLDESDASDGVIRVDVANIRTGPALDYDIICQENRGTLLKLISKHEDWYCIQIVKNGKEGYIYGDLVELKYFNEILDQELSIKDDTLNISENGKKQMENVIKYAENHNNGYSGGWCFKYVWKYLSTSGYGKINSFGDLPNMPSAYARNFADYLNGGQSRLDEAGLQRIDNKLEPFISNPHDNRIPDGAVIVVGPGSTGTAHPVAGDIVLKNGTKFINDGPDMWYGTESTWQGTLLGVYIPK